MSLCNYDKNNNLTKNKKKKLCDIHAVHLSFDLFLILPILSNEKKSLLIFFSSSFLTSLKGLLNFRNLKYGASYNRDLKFIPKQLYICGKISSDRY